MGFLHSSRCRTDLASWHEVKQHHEHLSFLYCYIMHTVSFNYIIACSLFQGWNSDHIFQFMNTISQAGNKLDCWHCLYHPWSLDAKFWGSGEPVSEASWCQPNLAYFLPNTPNYQQQPLKHIHMLRPHGALWWPRTQIQSGWGRQATVITLCVTITPKHGFSVNGTEHKLVLILETSWTWNNESAITNKGGFNGLWHLTWNVNNMNCQRYCNLTGPNSTCCCL